MLVFLVANILLSTSSYGQSFPSVGLTPSQIVMANIDIGNNKDASFLISPVYKRNLQSWLPLTGLPEINLVGGEFKGALGFNYDYHYSVNKHYIGPSKNDCFIRAEAQRGLWDLIAYGVLNYDTTGVGNNDDENEKIEQGLTAIKWTLDRVCYDFGGTIPWMGQEGDADGYSYKENGVDLIVHEPASEQFENTAHNKHMFLAAAGRALRLLKASGPSIYTPQRKESIKLDLASRLFDAANKLSGQTFILEKFFKQAIMDKKSANQLLLAAVAYHEIGLLWWELNDSNQTQSRADAAALIIRANKMMEQIIGTSTDIVTVGSISYFTYTGGAVGAQPTALLTNSGVLPEGKYQGVTYGGFDSSYQTFSLELMGRYYSTLKLGKEYSNKYYPKLQKALNRFLSNVNGGYVNTDCNTRTEGIPVAPAPGDTKIPWRLLYLDHLGVVGSVILTDTADEIVEKPQIFNHKQAGSQSPSNCLN